jgi:hypothetical protein
VVKKWNSRGDVGFIKEATFDMGDAPDTADK